MIDNYKGNDLSKYLNTVLPDCLSAKFGIGYFFLSGLKEIINGVSDLKELKLLISNTTDQPTKETLLIGFKKIKAANYNIDTYKKKIFIYGISLTSDERKEVINEAKQILDVADVVASIFLVEDLRIQKD